MERLSALELPTLLAMFGPLLARAGGPVVAPGWSLARWTAAEGLPVDGVSALAFTPDGYLWIATSDGLARFDGLRFATFDRASETTLPSNRFTAPTPAFSAAGCGACVPGRTANRDEPCVEDPQRKSATTPIRAAPMCVGPAAPVSTRPSAPTAAP